ncbi:hypothetical protein FACS189491_07870 [Spirochaetia bacterium]|nr:hypothetical protein FACS189491_07870 [Spirochaetia bacterium]
MGLYIYAYGIKIDEVYTILGSKDDDIYRRIIECNSYRDLDEPLGHGTFVDSEIPVSKAIKDLVYGEWDDIKADAAYAFALLCICQSVRKDLPHDLDIKWGAETDLINTRLAKDFRLRNFDIEVLLASPFYLFDLPDIYDELDIEPYECPPIGILTQTNLRYLKNRLKKIKIDDETVNKLLNSKNPCPQCPGEPSGDQNKGYEYQNIKWIIEDINYCLDNGLEMFTILG